MTEATEHSMAQTKKLLNSKENFKKRERERKRKKRQSMRIGENICKPYIQQEVNNTKHINNLYNSTAKNHPNKR